MKNYWGIKYREMIFKNYLCYYILFVILIKNPSIGIRDRYFYMFLESQKKKKWPDDVIEHY